MADEPTAKPALEEVTGTQLVASSGSSELTKSLPKSYATYRAMRTDPTIAMVRALSAAPVVAGEWSIEADDDVDEDRISFIQGQLMPLREPLVEMAMLGGSDFGWQGFEKVFAYSQKDAGRIIIRKVKSLLQDMTKILIDKDTGVFAGFGQTTADGKDILLPLDNSLLISFRAEGTQWHGQSLMENARGAYTNWNETNAVAARYDKRVAGANIIIHYPLGESKDADGNMTDNADIAKSLLGALEGTGSVIVPNVLSAYLEDLKREVRDKLGWRFEILSDGVPKQYAFVPRLRFLNIEKVRAFLIPERAILEGVFGTKADASEHGDIALTQMELTHRHITRYVNWYLVDQLLAINFGDDTRGTVRLVAAPLSKTAQQYLKDVYEKILTNNAGFLDEYGNIDTDAIKDTLGIPKSAEVAGIDDNSGEGNDIVPDDDTVASLTRYLKDGR